MRLRLLTWLFSAASNCSPDVKAAPACADDSWSLWKSNTGYFCCLTNQIGIKSTRYVGECVAGSVPVAVTQSATLVTAVGDHNPLDHPQNLLSRNIY